MHPWALPGSPEGAGHTPRSPARSDATLGALVRAYADRGAAPPVAVVLSVFDDLLEDPPEGAPRRAPRLDDVVIDLFGRARAASPLGLDGLGLLLARALGHGEADDGAVPGAARALLSRVLSDDPGDRPADAEQLRAWLRDHLGAPAPREEVVACLEEATSDVPRPALVETSAPGGPRSGLVALSGLDTLLPAPTGIPSAPLPVPAPVEDPSLAPAARPGNAALAARRTDPAARPLPVPAAVDSAPAVERRPESGDGRAVVRHVLSSPSDPRASLAEAPAARRSARPSEHSPDSLVVASERSGGLAWLAVAGVIGATVYLLFLT
jgi:hypothetical protein